MKKLVIILSALAVAACATPGARYEPIVDMRPGQSPTQYQSDLAECQVYATRVLNAQQGAVAGALFGAVLGVALGAAAGGNSRFNSRAAGVGAISGGVQGAASAEGGQRGIISRCMSGRGYNVLN